MACTIQGVAVNNWRGDVHTRTIRDPPGSEWAAAKTDYSPTALDLVRRFIKHDEVMIDSEREKRVDPMVGLQRQIPLGTLTISDYATQMPIALNAIQGDVNLCLT